MLCHTSPCTHSVLLLTYNLQPHTTQMNRLLPYNLACGATRSHRVHICARHSLQLQFLAAAQWELHSCDTQGTSAESLRAGVHAHSSCNAHRLPCWPQETGLAPRIL
jgi:hypothetical protein